MTFKTIPYTELLSRLYWVREWHTLHRLFDTHVFIIIPSSITYLLYLSFCRVGAVWMWIADTGVTIAQLQMKHDDDYKFDAVIKLADVFVKSSGVIISRRAR